MLNRSARRYGEKSEFVRAIFAEMDKVIVGQRYMLERMLIGMLANGHILLEGVQGLAKTMAMTILSRTINSDFKRIQFTPDLLLAQANQFFREANAISNDPNQAQRLYERAILNYEKIISDGKIQNSKLFYNLANAYFLKEDLGRAILNYRRAERLDKADTNIQKNLAFARSRRFDKVDVRAEERVFETLFFWHYDFSTRTRLLIACLGFGIVSISLAVMLWRGKAAPWIISASICGVLTICAPTSVIFETSNQSKAVYGVIIAEQVVARQGDGPNYPESFKEPLHAGTEFDLLEQRPGWFQIRLSDGSSSWIPANSADII